MNPIKTLVSYFQKLKPEVVNLESVESKPESIDLNAYAYDAAVPKPLYSGYNYRDWSGSTDDQNILDGLWIIRNRMKNLQRNNPVCNAILTSIVNHTIGDGFSFYADIPNVDKSVNDKIEHDFISYAENIDAGGELELEEIVRLAFNSALSCGDSFALFYPSRNTNDKYKSKIRLVDSDRVNTPADASTEIVKAGIIKNKFGDKIGIYINRSVESTNNTRSQNTDSYFKKLFYDADGSPQSLQLYFPKVLNQTRGLPLLTHCYDAINDLSTFSASELQAAVSASAINVILKSPNPTAIVNKLNIQNGATPNSLPINSQRPRWEQAPGAVNVIPYNWEFSQFQMDRPSNAFAPFLRVNLENICASIGHSYSYLFHNPADLNFSSSRFDAAQNQIVLKQYQNSIIRRLLNPIKRMFLAEMISNGDLKDIHLDDACAHCHFRFAPFKILDATKEIAETKMALDNGLISYQEACNKYGRDYDKVWTQRSNEKNELHRLGLVFPIPTKEMKPDQQEVQPLPNQPGRIPNQDSTLS